MSASGFALLWAKILDSSIWMQDDATRLVWITLLAMKDSQGCVYASLDALAHRARVEPEACRVAVEKFLSPDPQSTSPENEGRRLEVIRGGWRILNHDIYRFSTEAKREFWREQKRKQREKAGNGGRKRRGGGAGASRAEREYSAAETEEAALRHEELQSEVAPGSLGSYGPEAREAVNRGQVVPPEDGEMPDPDALPIPEV